MTSAEAFDLLVVGGGKAGKTLSMDRATAGQRVAMIEREMIGGTCINVACIPTKALVTSARALRTAVQAGDLGIAADRARVSWICRAPARRTSSRGWWRPTTSSSSTRAWIW